MRDRALPPSRHRASERGQATVELALVLPMVFACLLAVIQVSVVVRDQIAVQHAAREAARAASVDRDPAAAMRAARRVLARAEVHVGHRPAVGQPIVVEVTYRSRTDFPLVGAWMPDPELRGRAVMRVER
jgi:hypothetical protein